eukprot:1673108-Pleurochrysis_carterae.AAC.1
MQIGSRWVLAAGHCRHISRFSAHQEMLPQCMGYGTNGNLTSFARSIRDLDQRQQHMKPLLYAARSRDHSSNRIDTILPFDTSGCHCPSPTLTTLKEEQQQLFTELTKMQVAKVELNLSSILGTRPIERRMIDEWLDAGASLPWPIGTLPYSRMFRSKYGLYYP